MRLDLAERLRCPSPHAPTQLIVVAQESDGRELVRGFAGCPECHLEARIHDGAVRFPGFEEPSARVSTPHPAAHAVDRLRAQLGLGDDGGAVLLMGRYAAYGMALAAAMDVGVVTMMAPRATVRLFEAVVPFTDHSFRAVAMDMAVDPSMAVDAVRAVVPGGRVLGANPLLMPTMVKELARDQVEWVGEREAGPGGVVTIRRA
jgi:hypothetical protein